MKSRNSTLTTNTSNSVKTLKLQTSLMIKQQKINNSLQYYRTEEFLRFSKAKSINHFLKTYPFFFSFYFVETPNYKLKDVLDNLRVAQDAVICADNIEASQRLISQLDGNSHWLAQLFSTRPVHLVGFHTETEYLLALKKSILIEDESTAKMFALVFSYDNLRYFDLQKANSLSSDARQYYKKWDSSKSILIELLAGLQLPAETMASALSLELVAGASLSLSSINILPTFQEN